MKQQPIDASETGFPDSAADEVRRAVLSGKARPVEDLLARRPDTAADIEQALDLVYAEITAREEAGDSPCADEYAERFPQWAERIERLFEVHEAFRETESPETTPVAEVDSDSTIPGIDLSRDAVSHWSRLTNSRRVGQYELQEEIGSGATGIVFRARQAGLDRTVAVKVLRPFGDEESRERFHAEAELTARLRHPNIVQVYEVGQDSGCDFMSMEILEDGSLATMLGHTTFAPRAAAELVTTLATAVAAAHDQGIVHRDLKPGNVLMAPDGSPRISDFGLARHLSEAAVRQTRTGAILGTPGYMAPEQARGSLNAGPPADIYSLGAILYELLTGRPPYHGTSVVEILEQMQAVDPPGIRQLRPGVPRDLQTICMKCLERSPRDRYLSAARLREDLQRFLQGLPIHARPVSFLERAGRLAMRHRGIAALSVLLVLTIVAGTAGVFWQWLRAEDGLTSAKVAAEIAQSAEREQQRQRLVSEERLYRQQIQAADREIQSGSMDVGNRILQECDPDYRGWEWDLLNAAANSTTAVLDGHVPNQGRVEVSANGMLVAALRGSYIENSNRQVIVWDLETGRQKWKYAKDGMGLSLAFSPDSRTLLVCGHGTAILHDSQSGRVVKQFPVENRMSNWGAAFGPGGRRVAVPDGHTAKIFGIDPDDQRCVTCQGLEESGGAYAVSFHPNGRILAVASRNLGVTIHDCADGILLEQLPIALDTRSVEFNPDGSLLAASGYGSDGQGVLKIWEFHDSGFELLQTRFDSSGVRTGMRFSPDGQVIALWTGTSPIRLMNPLTLRETANYPVHAYTHQVAFGPDSRFLVTCGIESRVRIHDRSGEVRSVLTMSDAADPTDLAVHPSGTLAALVGDLRSDRRSARIHNEIEVVDLERWRRVHRLTGHAAPVTCVAYNASGSLLASGSDDRSVRLWNDAGRMQHTIDVHESPVVGVHFSPRDASMPGNADECLVSVDDRGRVFVHDAANFTLITEIDSGVDGVRHSASHENRVVLVTDHGQAVIVDLQRGVAHVVGNFDTPLRCVAFNPTGDEVCVSGDDGVVRLLRLPTKTVAVEVWHRSVDEGAALSVAFDPTGSRVVCTGEYGLIRLLRAADGNELLTLKTASYPGAVFRAMFDPQGRRLLATAYRMLYHWDSQPQPLKIGSGIPDDPIRRSAVGDWHVQQGYSCEADQNWQGAIQHWRKVGELNDRDALVHVFEARCHRMLQDWLAAEYCYRQALRVAKTFGYTEFSSRTNIELAEFLLACPDKSQRSALEAADFAVRALMTTPRSRPAWNALSAAIRELLTQEPLPRTSAVP
ncbi:MAG: serine/threonine-protein kinase [Planctomycetaceae bacterium]